MPKTLKPPTEEAEGACVCGAVRLAIGIPARWAFHDHSAQARRAQGCAYVTYVGSYRSRFRWLAGEDLVTCHTHEGTTRGFCSRCGAPLFMERKRAPTMATSIPPMARPFSRPVSRQQVTPRPARNSFAATTSCGSPPLWSIFRPITAK